MTDLDRLALQYWMSLSAAEKKSSEIGPPVFAFRRLLEAGNTKLPAKLEAQRAAVLAEARRVC